MLEDVGWRKLASGSKKQLDQNNGAQLPVPTAV